jgi:hypothetical protein
MNARCRSAMIVAGLLLSCSVMLGAWTQLNPGIMGGLYNGIYFLPGNTDVGYACGTGLDTASHLPAGLVAKTTDGGDSWVPQIPGTPNTLLSIYFTDATTGYVCGIGSTVMKTIDGGATWAAKNTGVGANEQLTYVSFPSNGQTGYLGVTTDAAKVYKTVNGGDNWNPVAVGGAMSRSTSCAMATDTTGIVFGPDAFVYSAPGGYQDPQAPGCIMIAADYSPTDNNRAYLVGNDTVLDLGIIRYTTTGGNPKWDSVSCPVIPSFNCVEYASPETAYIGGASGFIGRTFNSHDFWRTNTGVTNQINSICFPNGPDTGYAAAGPIILKTTDAGGLLPHWVADGESPGAVRAGIRITSDPCRGGIPLRSDVNVRVTVFDPAGRAVLNQAAGKGLTFLPLRAGAYFVRAGCQTARAVVTD